MDRSLVSRLLRTPDFLLNFLASEDDPKQAATATG